MTCHISAWMHTSHIKTWLIRLWTLDIKLENNWKLFWIQTIENYFGFLLCFNFYVFNLDSNCVLESLDIRHNLSIFTQAKSLNIESSRAVKFVLSIYTSNWSSNFLILNPQIQTEPTIHKIITVQDICGVQWFIASTYIYI